MTDSPLLFRAPMVRALLDGTKTQTRRGLKISGFKDFSEFGRSDSDGYDWHFRRADKCWVDLRHDELLARLPWQVGGRIWVKETWQLHSRATDFCAVAYRASILHAGWNDAHEQFPDAFAGTMQPKPFQQGWRPSIFMPRWASRLTLTVTDVRVERLQDCSAADAIAEGIERDNECPNLWKRGKLEGDQNLVNVTAFPVLAYRSLWESINGQASWKQNPWVVALTFEVERGNIGQ